MLQRIEQVLCVRNLGLLSPLASSEASPTTSTSSSATGSTRQPSREGQVLYLYFLFPAYHQMLRDGVPGLLRWHTQPGFHDNSLSFIRHLAQTRYPYHHQVQVLPPSVERGSFRPRLLPKAVWRPLPLRPASTSALIPNLLGAS